MAETITPARPLLTKGRAGMVGLAIGLIAAFEGFAPVGWHDRIDPPGINTIGYGHIEDVQIGDRVTKEQAQDLLAKDLPRYEKMVNAAIHVPMPPHRYAAILSFTYNVGGGALKRSSVARYLNKGDVQRGCDALMLYDRANGKVIKGLQNRRRIERQHCLRTD